MRLTNEQILTIKTIVLRNFGPAAKLILFGSRLDDSKRGGDIDLLVETNLSPEDMFIKKIAALGQLQRALGEQKFDPLTAATGTKNVPEVVEIARKQGVSL